MTAMTYGILPTREAFDAAFERECPDGYRITLGRSDSDAVEGFRLGDGTWTADQLWEAINEIVDDAKDGWPRHDADGDWFQNGRDDTAMDLVSSIMTTLGFEWV